ncbi:restriction endonuclease, M subunit [Corynebacterium phocae]|uniref:site-specific DNA-methyltransferase (adenine-specific) n=1 Tax=Corynebacterium phocae TaxID=161895 RepID=A0A1L7D5V6_9CORY|nr:type I restriction-modification system subunit M [Corynebacterium phocae]APT93457.1 restriction endonuclease, M subunit [Corynebacterium phocae]KAA8721151.1 type I restriction-modification system subunit M [Corynebacterium phocae]
MDNNVQRAALHKTLWHIANDLRGTVDGWDLRTYVLGILFYRFISENLTAHINADIRAQGAPNFSYAHITDKAARKLKAKTLAQKGFFIAPSDLFQNRAEQANPADNLEQTLRRIEDSGRRGLLDGLFQGISADAPALGTTPEERAERLNKLIWAVGTLPLRSATGEAIDLFGDAYEYLIQMYASTAGKSGGEFFTPQEVSALLARITIGGRKAIGSVYDPALGSGSLLLQFAQQLGNDNIGSYHGQEINSTSYNLARMNMLVHDIAPGQFNLKLGNTLSNPQRGLDAPFDAVVSNPPYSIKWEGKDNPALACDPRFTPAGALAPKSKADLAFVMHILSVLSDEGRAAVVLFPGVLYRTGAEKKIRTYLIESGLVEAVIALPPDLFFGTAISTCIMVLQKQRRDRNVLFIDATDQFQRIKGKNVITAGNREQILDWLGNRTTELPYVTVVAPEEIAAKNFDLSPQQYLDASSPQTAESLEDLEVQLGQVRKQQEQLRGELFGLLARIEARESQDRQE